MVDEDDVDDDDNDDGDATRARMPHGQCDRQLHDAHAVHPLVVKCPVLGTAPG